MQNYAVNIENLNKTYRLYNKPSDRVKEALGFGKKQSKTFEALKDVSFNVKKGERKTQISSRRKLPAYRVFGSI